MEKINIAEILRNCPKDMELDCTMYEDVYFDYVDELNIIHCYIQQETHKTAITFNQHGTPNSDIKSKCVIYPKGKTTWEGFKPPFKDGDIIYVKSKKDGGVGLISIYKNESSSLFYDHCCVSTDTGTFYIDNGRATICKNDIGISRFASEEEKQELFKAIKDNGYKWNPEAKTLEKLIEPKFKVGDRIRHCSGTGEIKTISKIVDEYCFDDGGFILFSEQDSWRLVPNKFNINTLKPFNKVLVRYNKDNKWCCSFFSHIDKEHHSHCYKYVTTSNKSYPYCIPYEDNEHLRGTTDDCEDYYKTWE